MTRALIAALLLLAGCSQEMDNQPRYEAYEASARFPENQSALPLPPHAVPTGPEELLPEVMEPIPVTRALLEFGRERFEIFCAPCHSATGDGDGMIVRRGFPRPPSFHSQRLVQIDDGHFYNVITHGYGAMYSYASRVPPRERWAIIAYIRALQLSRRVHIADLPEGVPEPLREAAE